MGKVKSGFKSAKKSVNKGLKQIDPTTKKGLANLATGGSYGFHKNIAKKTSKPIKKGLAQLDPTTKTGLANITTGGMFGVHKNAIKKAKVKIQGEQKDEAPAATPTATPTKSPSTDGKIGNSMDGKSFDEINAEITRRQWDQFEKNDKPYILNYADEITSGKYTDRAISQARDGVTQGFAQAESSQQMRDSGMGVGLSRVQTADRSSDMARSKTASLIDAENNARLAATDRDNALLAGSHMPKTGN